MSVPGRLAATWTAAHGAWMIRGYAIGLGAGTQVLTFLIWFLIGGPDNELGRSVVMGSGCAINIVVAEWAIRRMAPSPSRQVLGRPT